MMLAKRVEEPYMMPTFQKRRPDFATHSTRRRVSDRARRLFEKRNDADEKDMQEFRELVTEFCARFDASSFRSHLTGSRLSVKRDLVDNSDKYGLLRIAIDLGDNYEALYRMDRAAREAMIGKLRDIYDCIRRNMEKDPYISGRFMMALSAIPGMQNAHDDCYEAARVLFDTGRFDPSLRLLTDLIERGFCSRALELARLAARKFIHSNRGQSYIRMLDMGLETIRDDAYDYLAFLLRYPEEDMFRHGIWEGEILSIFQKLLEKGYFRAVSELPCLCRETLFDERRGMKRDSKDPLTDHQLSILRSLIDHLIGTDRPEYRKYIEESLEILKQAPSRRNKPSK